MLDARARRDLADAVREAHVPGKDALRLPPQRLRSRVRGARHRRRVRRDQARPRHRAGARPPARRLERRRVQAPHVGDRSSCRRRAAAGQGEPVHLGGARRRRRVPHRQRPRLFVQRRARFPHRFRRRRRPHLLQQGGFGRHEHRDELAAGLPRDGAGASRTSSSSCASRSTSAASRNRRPDETLSYPNPVFDELDGPALTASGTATAWSPRRRSKACRRSRRVIAKRWSSSIVSCGGPISPTRCGSSPATCSS